MQESPSRLHPPIADVTASEVMLLEQIPIDEKLYTFRKGDIDKVVFLAVSSPLT